MVVLERIMESEKRFGESRLPYIASVSQQKCKIKTLSFLIPKELFSI
jgi:hypothetical protein